MKFLIVEDDYLQADTLEDVLLERYPGAEVDRIRTEHQFMGRIDELRKKPPDIALLDIMVRWTDPTDNMPDPPSEVEEGGYFGAGIRCMKKLRSVEETADMPIILYTVLQDSDMEELNIEETGRTRHVTKDSDTDELFEAIDELLENRLEEASR